MMGICIALLYAYIFMDNLEGEILANVEMTPST